jgi:pyruvate dehydrogenase E1 component alpha subunit
MNPTAPDIPLATPLATAPLRVIGIDDPEAGLDPRLDDEQLLHLYRTMLATRAFDATCMKLQRSGRIGFSVPNLGIEACSVGAASALKSSDWIFPSYRDYGMALYHGAPVLNMMNHMFGNGEDAARGRQMPAHFTFVDPIHFVSISSPIGTHLPQAVGAAHAAQLRGEDTAVLVSFGDGGTSSLGFHSALNFAGVWKSPVVFLCQNNGWAISCPSSEQTASEGYAVKASAYGIPGVAVDGNDVLAMHRAVADAVERARNGEGPTLVEAITYRMGGHSSSDDPRKYVPEAEIAGWRERDPIELFEKYLAARDLWSEELREKLQAEVQTEVEEAARQAERNGAPTLDTLVRDVYEEVPPHLRRQGREAHALAQRRGDAAVGDGSFPL